MSWKREEIPDHKFDYVDVDEFVDNSLARRLAYSTVFVFAIKDILVYMADLASAAILISANKAALFENKGNGTIIFNTVDLNDIGSSKENQNAIIQALGGPTVILALILASLVASFILLAFEWRKAQRIIKSRDISYAFTSQVAYSYYTIRSYPHYCFFSQIQNSRKPVDVLAFWVFFKFRGWKRLILAEFPRQFLNALILYDIFQQKENGTTRSFVATVQKLLRLEDKTVLVFVTLQFITVTIWIISFLGLFIAFIVYIPLLCNIRGNLKEYCVHKIDKRIGEILKRKTRKRLQDARRMEQEKIASTDTITNQPTLPQVDLDLDSEYDSGVYQYPSEYGSEVGYYGQYAYQQGYQTYVPSNVSGQNPGYAASSVSGYSGYQPGYQSQGYQPSYSNQTQGQYRRRPS